MNTKLESQTLDASDAILKERAKPAPLFTSSAVSEVGKRVHKYFETSGFSRWTSIYGDGDIPPIWKIIRDGHQRALDKVVEWTKSDTAHTALDAGCGTGNLALQLAHHGYEVDAFDVSAPMIHYARYINSGRTKGIQPRFMVGDIGCVSGDDRSYDLVACLDVLFHYPLDEVNAMLTQLAKLSSHKVVASFALRTGGNDFWMTVGKKFSRKDRMTHLHLFTYDEIEQIMYRAGFKITRTSRVKFFFYDSFVFEAVRAS